MMSDGFDPETRTTRLSRFIARCLCGEEKGLTLSAMTWDRQIYRVRWRFVRIGLDTICRVFWRETEHCRNAYAREMLRYYIDAGPAQKWRKIGAYPTIYSMSSLTNETDKEEQKSVGHHR